MPTEGSAALTIPVEVMALLRRHDLQRTLVQRQVIAEAVAAVSITSDDQEQLLQAYRQRHRLEDAESMQKHLQLRGLHEPDLQWQLELPVRIQRHSEQAFGAKAEQRFLERKNTLDQVVYSLLRLKDGYLALELYLQIAEKESDFADLAARYAEGPERTTRGVVGPVPLTQAHPLLSEKLRTCAPGSLFEPFQIEQWWLVVRLERYLPATFDDTMQQRMCGELFDEWVQEQVARKLTATDVNSSAARAA
jgi:parvulin-like peptidyl-prolyl isomerase